MKEMGTTTAASGGELTTGDQGAEAVAGTWFGRHRRFGDCKPNEVYIGQGAFAEFCDGYVRLRSGSDSIVIDFGGVSILGMALEEYRAKDGRVTAPPPATTKAGD